MGTSPRETPGTRALVSRCLGGPDGGLEERFSPLSFCSRWKSLQDQPCPSPRATRSGPGWGTCRGHRSQCRQSMLGAAGPSESGHPRGPGAPRESSGQEAQKDPKRCPGGKVLARQEVWELGVRSPGWEGQGEGAGAGRRLAASGASSSSRCGVRGIPWESLLGSKQDTAPPRPASEVAQSSGRPLGPCPAAALTKSRRRAAGDVYCAPLWRTGVRDPGVSRGAATCSSCPHVGVPLCVSGSQPLLGRTPVTVDGDPPSDGLLPSLPLLRPSLQTQAVLRLWGLQVGLLRGGGPSSARNAPVSTISHGPLR